MAGGALTAQVVIVLTMSADIVDYGLAMSGEDHGGLYSSLFSFIQKSIAAVSAAAAIAIVGMMGFDATAASQSTSGTLGIKLASGVLPAFGLLAAAAIIWNYPLTRARTAEIQEQIKARRADVTPS